MRTQAKKRVRRLQLEQLDARRMLAADFYHNFVIPEDVDANGVVTPRDVLIGINHLNGAVAEKVVSLLDVNADGHFSPVDLLTVINNINENRGESLPSAVPVAARIDRIRDAIAASDLPPQFDLHRTQEVLETLEHGGYPELGETITTTTLAELRDAIAEGETPVVDAVFNTLGIQNSADDVVQQVESTLLGFGIDISNVVESVQGVIDTLPEGTAQVADQVVEILNNLGSEGSELGQQVSDLLNSEEVQALVTQVNEILTDAGVDIADLQARLDEFVAGLPANVESIRDAVLSVIDGVEGNDLPLRDQIVALVQSEAVSNIRETVETQLNNFNIDISGVQAAVDDFAARLAAGETPLRDWLASLLGSGDGVAAVTQLAAEAESLGVNVDDLLASIGTDLSTITAAADELVNSLTGGTGSVGQLLDDILARVSADGAFADIGAFVDGILGDVDGFLTDLFPGADLLDSLLG